MIRPVLSPVLNPILNPVLKAVLFAIKEKEQWVSRLDGATQFWQLSGGGVTIPAGTDFEIIIEDVFAESDSAMVLATDTTFPNIYCRSDGSPVFQPADGLFIPSGLSIVGRKVSLSVSVVGSTMSISEVGGAGLATREISPLPELVFTTIGVRVGALYLAGYVGKLTVKVDNTLTHEIPLTNKAQGAFQVATTTPLGDNLYTQEIIENPESAGDQWSYLGNGRWQLIGDGNPNALVFLPRANQPNKGYVQFEIESISGGTLTCSRDFQSASVFGSVGVKAYYYSDIAGIVEVQFKRGTGSINAVIKNITHFDANGVLIATMPNYTEAAWRNKAELV